jgi:glycerol kinase
MGAAFLAGIQIGWWKKQDILANRKIQRKFEPDMEENTRAKLYKGWQKAVERTMGWIDR